MCFWVGFFLFIPLIGDIKFNISATVARSREMPKNRAPIKAEIN